MLEWSCLYRVTLLLSKINDDSDLDAEAAILYGKVGTYVDAKCSSRIGIWHLTFILLYNCQVRCIAQRV